MIWCRLLPRVPLDSLENRMVAHLRPNSLTLDPLNAVAHAFAKDLNETADLGWEITAEGDSNDAWRIRPNDERVRARSDQWAIVRLSGGWWSVAEMTWATRPPAGETPWERLRALADQLEREAAAS